MSFLASNRRPLFKEKEIGHNYMDLLQLKEKYREFEIGEEEEDGHPEIFTTSFLALNRTVLYARRAEFSPHDQGKEKLENCIEVGKALRVRNR